MRPWRNRLCPGASQRVPLWPRKASPTIANDMHTCLRLPGRCNVGRQPRLSIGGHWDPSVVGFSRRKRARRGSPARRTAHAMKRKPWPNRTWTVRHPAWGQYSPRGPATLAPVVITPFSVILPTQISSRIFSEAAARRDSSQVRPSHRFRRWPYPLAFFRDLGPPSQHTSRSYVLYSRIYE